MAPFFGICEKSFLYKQILQNILRTLPCLFGLREAIAKGNFKNHVQLLSKMTGEIAKVFLEEIGSGNMLCAAVEENGMGQNRTCECSNAHYKYDRAL
ncbi:hypothetical protein T4A_2369 [Trichinella pseudospiralis]|uniref:Uncharacterized protein n=1 Tax=Trichinella pseudospiralis TaxID=6337 RepID=A0A0V1DQS2_TRIPS|nr:hypothetical protein T4A_2369 [Trichinella pseudospiralis]